MFAVIDVETTDLLRKGAALDDPSQPHIIQASALLCEEDGSIRSALRDAYVKPGDDWRITPGAARTHGITLQDARRWGQALAVVLGHVVGLCANVRTIVAYGSFDFDVVTSELLRMGKSTRSWDRPGLQKVDVMEAATVPADLVREDGTRKWPSLSEAVVTLLGREHEGAHSSWWDANATLELFLHLRARGFIEGGAA